MEICDVTLRDGEQAPGTSFSEDEKCEIAGMLDEVGVDLIEAGFPPVSVKEQRAVYRLANLGLDARVCCLCRAYVPDVDLAQELDISVISIFAPTSDLLLENKMGSSLEEVTAGALDALDRAKSYGMYVRFASEDSSRTRPSELLKFFQAGEEGGADMVSITDTVGVFMPAVSREVVKIVSGGVNLPIAVHFHDDLGLAVANTLTALEAGAEQLHTTVNGIGERAGNAALEEVLAALYLHYDCRSYDLTPLKRLSETVVRYSGIEVAKNKAVVGRNTFSHESGIHIAAVLKDPACYEPFPPETVGQERRFVFGKHSGATALKHFIRDQDIEVDEEMLSELLEEVKGYKGLTLNELKELLMRKR